MFDKRLSLGDKIIGLIGIPTISIATVIYSEKFSIFIIGILLIIIMCLYTCRNFD